MRIPSGKTDQLIFFVAVDSIDRLTRKTGLSSFTVYRSRNGGAATVYTTPTVAELSSANMPGVYSLAVDEDTTVASGSDSEEYCVHITCSTMAPVTRTIELYRRDTTTGRTLDVSSGGEAGLDWANVGSPTTSLALTNTTIAATQKVDVDTIKTNPVANGGTITFPSGATLASTTNITAGTMTTTTNLTTNNDKTGYTLSNTGMDNLLDRTAGIETNRTLRQGLRLMLAALVGKASGLATTTATYRDTNDGVDRVVATVDASGNRSAVTLDAS